MKYTIKSIEKKSPEWYVLEIVDGSGQITHDVSVNKTNKQGQVFPDFDNLVEGGDVIGDFWSSSAGKNYLFAPKPETQKSGRPNMDRIMEKKQSAITESQTKKAENIAQAQDRNMWMWAKYSASELVASLPAYSFLGEEDVVKKVVEIATKIYHAEPTPFE